jgi:hypothetical protein
MKSLLKTSKLIIIFIILWACTENKKNTKTNEINSSLIETKTIILDSNFVLENLIHLADYKAIESKYGQNNIKKDTIIFDLKGAKIIASVLMPNQPEEVFLYWDKKQPFRKIESVEIKGDSTGYQGKWHSITGLMPGQALNEVVKLNEKAFTISGFGWEYAGHVISWEGGKLDNKNVTGNFKNYKKGTIKNSEMTSIQGDTEFNVNLEAIKKLDPILEKLIVLGKK